MPEFLELYPPEEALNLVLQNISSILGRETVETSAALGRVTAEPILAGEALPAFPRATVDGYAVRAADTYGAGESLPAYLKIVGEVMMGSRPDLSLGPGECALIHTGGMLPVGADAVVMLEHTQKIYRDEVEVWRAVALGENVLQVGEDVKIGEMVIPAGTRLRPAEIGGLMALGITQIQVFRRPQVGILSNGDEVVPPEVTPAPGQVRDVNSYTLSALVEQVGAVPMRYGIVPDQAALLKAKAAKALDECDVVVITAGSSASARDLTAEIIHQLGSPGVLVHGVNVRPGKPTILAVCGGKAVIGLPGNPVSALVIAGLFLVPILETLLGIEKKRPRGFVPARLTINIPSQAGREDWLPVSLVMKGEEYLAEPVFGKSNLIFTLARADGLVRIPPDVTGLSSGESVHVFLF